MRPSLTALLTVIRSSLRTRVELEAEILALRHQLAVLQQTEQRRLRLSQTDRLLWVLLSGVWSRWREAVQIVQPATVVSWHRASSPGTGAGVPRDPRLGRPPIATDVRALIQKMHRANPLWGAPHIHGELQTLGIGVTAASIRARRGKTLETAKQLPTGHRASPRPYHSFLGICCTSCTRLTAGLAPPRQTHSNAGPSCAWLRAPARATVSPVDRACALGLQGLHRGLRNTSPLTLGRCQVVHAIRPQAICS